MSNENDESGRRLRTLDCESPVLAKPLKTLRALAVAKALALARGETRVVVEDILSDDNFERERRVNRGQGGTSMWVGIAEGPHFMRFLEGPGKHISVQPRRC